MNNTLSLELLRDELRRLAHSHFQFTITPDQEQAINRLSDFVTGTTQSQIFILRGYAGTGKTTLVSAIIFAMKEAGMNFALLAPTGKAAKVLGTYACEPTSTIHHHIFEIDRVVGDDPEFRLSINQESGVVYFVDESSMINDQPPGKGDIVFGSGGLLHELIAFIYARPENRLVFIGDPAQLPPVKSDLSPALDRGYLSQVYEKSVDQITLSMIVRQAEESGIRALSMQIRKIIESNEPSSSILIPKVGDTLCISRDALRTAYCESREMFGGEETTILAHQNRVVNHYNALVRTQFLGYQSELYPGEDLAITSNNYNWWVEGQVDYLANGEIVKIERIGQKNELGKYHFMDVDISARGFDGSSVSLFGKILLNPLYPPYDPITNSDRDNLFRAVLRKYQGGSRRDCEIAARQDPFYTSLLARYSYALTVHRAQGSGWKTVFLDMSNFGWQYRQNTHTALRWLYTAVTRAKQRLYLIGLPAGATTIPLG
jgi:exodeoxyribonuclease-5